MSKEGLRVGLKRVIRTKVKLKSLSVGLIRLG